METIKYAEIVIQQVHTKTLQGELKWKCSHRELTADPTPAIYVIISFKDEGPDSAIWESMVVKHPLGSGITLLSNPSSSKAGLYEQITFASVLDQVNEIFRYVLLDPRKQEFEVAMKELLGMSYL